MAKRILVLEDNEDRRAAMREWLADRLGMYELCLTDDPVEFIECLIERPDDVVAVSLDHDLHERADASTALTGMQVVEYLLTARPAFPVLLHTSNEREGARMRQRLKQAGWNVAWIVPFDGTNWVGLAWYRALKKAIRAAAPRATKPPPEDQDE